MDKHTENLEWARTAVRAMLNRLAVLAVVELQCEGLRLMAAASRVKRWKP